jgi:3-keto-5-aminohexanoate cleavage enzyme
VFDLNREWTDLPSREVAQTARGTADMDGLPTPDVQPPWDIPDVLVLTAAVSGRVAREMNVTTQYGLDFDSFVAAAAGAINAGACGIHLDFNGIDNILDSGLSVPDRYDKVAREIKDATNRDWVCDANILTGENFAENVYPITSGIAETAPFAPNFPVDWMESAAKVIDDKGARMHFAIHSTAEVDLANRLVLSKGILTQRPFWSILIGYPYNDRTTRLCTYLAHPKAMMQELILIVDRIKEIDPDAFIQVCSAGRASQYLITTAMLLGLHVRVGTEDTAFRYPHRDELLVDSTESVERARRTAETLGRRLATPNEFRAILGLPQRATTDTLQPA